MPEAEGDNRSSRWIRLVAGVALSTAAYLALGSGDGSASTGEAALTPAGRITVAIMVLMAVWWLTEAVHVSVTALLPALLLPLLGVSTLKDACRPYADPVIFLFAGGFLMAEAMRRWRLDRRIALHVLRLVGDRPAAIVAGMMIATACISAFVSNTATAAMMLPVATSVLALAARSASARRGESPRYAHFEVCLLLGIAYAASLGGVITLVGTPPNAFLAGWARETLPENEAITFASWLPVGLGVSAIMMPATWFALTRVIFPVERARLSGVAELIQREQAELGQMSQPEWITFIVFVLTALLWMVRPLVNSYVGGGLTDEGLAIAAAIALFLAPAGGGRGPVLDWESARSIPWSVLILFGGGLSLSEAIAANGVAEWVSELARGADSIPMWATTAGTAASVTFLSELASNTATATTIVPIVGSAAKGLGAHPLELAVPAALAASYAFMMPVGTPPNAMVYATGKVTMGQMWRAGLVLNIMGIVVVTLMVPWLVHWFLLP